MSDHVKISPENITPWSKEEFQTLLDSIENDLDDEMLGAQIAIRVKLGETRENVKKLKEKLTELTEIDVYYRSIERSLTKLKKQDQCLVVIVQKLALMRNTYHEYLHVRDLPSYSTPEVNFS
ncbi:hypothetical protein TVAGG3_0778250 [Trichomonas vaginalis G3]|uniref:hypothetical protein n=1 Tax=Trichomonas vaginalis (strain ATCC PRA-98 / G3) TaxID=412133 RepID=UPI0021E58723|nr:hypothetical protein TVAGG3_0778250 [Trichomonas vaginalis G3]KAI5494870.1 hypothetical protein TVAGG3_0778250 [Trichomonas vaginalis G3]